MNAGPKELNEAFVRSLPDNGPVVMVNLLHACVFAVAHSGAA